MPMRCFEKRQVGGRVFSAMLSRTVIFSTEFGTDEENITRSFHSSESA